MGTKKIKSENVFFSACPHCGNKKLEAVFTEVRRYTVTSVYGEKEEDKHNRWFVGEGVDTVATERGQLEDCELESIWCPKCADVNSGRGRCWYSAASFLEDCVKQQEAKNVKTKKR